MSLVDLSLTLKYCRNCVVTGRDMGVDSAEFHIWQEWHAVECNKNFDETSGAMECTLHHLCRDGQLVIAK
ncbi:hypothetical protein TNCV_618841 [Trichonephila clavipes]|nr:hypothetical protein TNCV_618841 [Trichonephila clavipes]